MFFKKWRELKKFNKEINKMKDLWNDLDELRQRDILEYFKEEIKTNPLGFTDFAEYNSKLPPSPPPTRIVKDGGKYKIEYGERKIKK